METATADCLDENESLDDSEDLTIEKLLNQEDKLIRKVVRYIEKHHLKMVDFSHQKLLPVFDIEKDFPSNRDQIDAKFLFNGNSVFGVWANHAGQRDLTSSNIVKYSVKMLTGEWRNYLPQGGLVFDWNRQGINDQHRMAALYIASLINPDIKIGFCVAFNADPADIRFYDDNRVKTQTDLLMVETKLDNTWHEYEGVDKIRLNALVRQVPSLKGATDKERQMYTRTHIATLKKCLDLLDNVRTVSYNPKWAGVFIDAIIGSDGKGFTDPTNTNAALNLLSRFCKNMWLDYLTPKQIDPMQALFKKLVEDMNAKKADKMGKLAIRDISTFLLRKALLGLSITEGQGAKNKPKFTLFLKEEFDDFRKHGTASQVMKNNSVARKENSKKKKEEED